MSRRRSRSRASRAFAARRSPSARTRTLGDLCVKAYNDWMIDEWCAGTNGRLIPLIIVQLWDAELAAAEIRRNAARGCHAVTFSEIPPFLGFPSIHDKDGYWDPFLAACEETETVINMHIGSSSKMPSTSADAPGCGRIDAHVHERRDVAHRLADVGCVRTLPRSHDRVQRGPDRLDPVRARARRQGVGGQPRVGWRRRQGEAPAVGVLLRARVRLLLRRPARSEEHSTRSARTTSRSRPTTRTPTRRGRTRRRSPRRS